MSEEDTTNKDENNSKSAVLTILGTGEQVKTKQHKSKKKKTKQTTATIVGRVNEGQRSLRHYSSV